MATATPVTPAVPAKKPTAPAPVAATPAQLSANAKAAAAKPNSPLPKPASPITSANPSLSTQPVSPTPPISSTNGLLAALQQMVGNVAGVQAGQNSIANTGLQNQLGLSDLLNKLQTGQINQNTALSQGRLDLSNQANQQAGAYLDTTSQLSNQGYQNQLSDLMANMGFTKQYKQLSDQQQQNALGDITQNRQYTAQENDLQNQSLAANRATTDRNEPIIEKQMKGSEAASGSAASAGYGERFGQLRASYQDQLDSYERQKQQQDLTFSQQNTGFNNQTRDVNLGGQITKLQQAQTTASQTGQQRDLALGQKGAVASQQYQKTTLENVSKSLGIDKKALDQGTQAALDQLGISTMVSKEQIWQAFMDKQAGTYNALAPLLSAVQSVMGITPPAKVDVGTPNVDAFGTKTGGTSKEGVVYGNPTLQTQFSSQLSQQLGVPSQNQQSAIQMLNAWMQAEGNKTAYNPLSTTLNEPGATSFNHVGVRNYPDMASGVQATIDTLTKSKSSYGYGPIVQALRSGDTSAFVRAIQGSKWGSNASNIARILGGGK